MKISASIKRIYEERRDIYGLLKDEVDRIFLSLKDSRWHYESRIKELESFALKAETGRFFKISEMEDFFASTLVVENYSLLPIVEEKVYGPDGKFELIERRPKEKGITHKAPKSFDFDDVRLYLKLKIDDRLPPREIDNLVFELQVKTFLQHAWSIATHDLIYKSDSIDWPSNRIAYQIKAMLEHAEISISQAPDLARDTDYLPTSKDFLLKNNVLGFLKNNWEADKLPRDLVRLVDNVVSLMSVASINFEELVDICCESELIGQKPKENLSPYTAIALSVFFRKSQVVVRKVNQRSKGYILIPPEAEDYIPPDLRERISKIKITPS